MVIIVTKDQNRWERLDTHVPIRVASHGIFHEWLAPDGGWTSSTGLDTASIFFKRNVWFCLQLFHFVGNAAIVKSKEAITQQVLW